MKPSNRIDDTTALPAGTPRYVSKRFIYEHSGGAVGTTRLWHAIKEGKVVAKQLGRLVLIDFGSYQRWLNDQPSVDYSTATKKPPGRRGARRKDYVNSATT